ncbi:oligoribonuclease isoform X2 [Momordica charantia]|uniref:Oligoribonuclease isoform X2 n=1 Tax=Momordica charantia TaxID=3673 RepID=A0A6J1DHZ9_MOMCH|nr:oligoribonuclease isoform X2 [Momordica charantia]XP_022153846.1 oligoribonuclease isoform X2 [Momordica charantia]
MQSLVNAFSVLELDAEDDQIPALSTFSKPDATASSSSKTGKSKKEVDISGDIPTGERQKQSLLDVAAEDYKLPLVWIDLEMTGLNVETDRILEIACIVTNGNLTKLAEGPDLVIHQSKECLEKMGEWCQTHHAASGLTKKVLRSTISEREAEKQVIEFVKKYVGSYTPLLAGNSVYTDFIFLKIRRKPHIKRINTGLWTISEKALWNSNITRKIYLRSLKSDAR